MLKKSGIIISVSLAAAILCGAGGFAQTKKAAQSDLDLMSIDDLDVNANAVAPAKKAVAVDAKKPATAVKKATATKSKEVKPTPVVAKKNDNNLTDVLQEQSLLEAQRNVLLLRQQLQCLQQGRTDCPEPNKKPMMGKAAQPKMPMDSMEMQHIQPMQPMKNMPKAQPIDNDDLVDLTPMLPKQKPMTNGNKMPAGQASGQMMPPPPPPPPSAKMNKQPVHSMPDLDDIPNDELAVDGHDYAPKAKQKIYSKDYVFGSFGMAHVLPHNKEVTYKGDKYQNNFSNGFALKAGVGYQMDMFSFGLEGMFEYYKLLNQSHVNNGFANGGLLREYASVGVSNFRVGPRIDVHLPISGETKLRLGVGAGLGIENLNDSPFVEAGNVDCANNGIKTNGLCTGTQKAYSQVYPYSKLEGGIAFQNGDFSAAMSYGLFMDYKNTYLELPGENVMVKGINLTSQFGFTTQMQF